MKNVPNNLSNLRSKVDKLDVDKLVPAPVDLSKLSDVLKNVVVEKDVYNAKTKNIEDAFNAKINEVKNEVSSITNLPTTTALNAKIIDVQNEIPNITNLATTTALTTVENKISNISNLVKITDYNARISEIEKRVTTDHDHNKYITTQESNKLTAAIFNARLAQANLASASDIANFVKKTDFDNELKILLRIKMNQTNYRKKVKSISTKGLASDLINKFSILNGAKYFSSRIFKNYLVFKLAKKNTLYILVALLGMIRGNLMEYQNLMECHFLSDICFNE